MFMITKLLLFSTGKFAYVLCPNKTATWTELETYSESEMSSLNKEISGVFSEPRMRSENLREISFSRPKPHHRFFNSQVVFSRF